MTNRILFEEDIEEQNINIIQNIQTQQASSRGNIEQDGIINSNLNDIQPTGKVVSNVDVDIFRFSKNNEGNTNPVNDKGKNTNKEVDEGKNDQVIDRTENTDKGNELGNSDHLSLEKANEVPLINENENEKECRERGTLGQDNAMVCISHSLKDGDVRGHHVDIKKERRLKKELQLLGADVNPSDDEGKFDVFGDDSKIYRKYRLRKTESKISYEEPSDWKPKRRASSDNKPMLLECTVCYQEFETKKALRIHQRSHGTVLEYTCLLCSQKFDKNSDLIAHKSIHKSESFLCQECKVAFSDHCDYLQHQVMHTTRSVFTCPECGLKYNRTCYKLHIWTHFDRKFNCHICSYVGKSEGHLQSHINDRHRHSKSCVECGRVFHNNRDMEYHMISHTGVKKYQCFYCGKCYGNNSARKLHTRQHTGEKPYTCDICGHKSAQFNDMKLHKTTHETEKKYSCHLCPKKYFYKSYLVIHMRSHTQECLYECPECDGKFVNTSGLKTHYMYKHLSERPVECKICNKHFINNNQYKRHTKSKNHKRNMYGRMLNNNE